MSDTFQLAHIGRDVRKNSFFTTVACLRNPEVSTNVVIISWTLMGRTRPSGVGLHIRPACATSASPPTVSPRARPWSWSAAGREVCAVVLEGVVTVRSGAAHFERIGKRRSVFEDQPPYAVYLPVQRRSR